jgi:hypothetical protein
LQNSPLESSCVVVALIENYSTSKPLKVSPEKSHFLSCDTVVANERYIDISGSAVKLFHNYRTYTDIVCMGGNFFTKPLLSVFIA